MEPQANARVIGRRPLLIGAAAVTAVALVVVIALSVTSDEPISRPADAAPVGTAADLREATPSTTPGPISTRTTISTRATTVAPTTAPAAARPSTTTTTTAPGPAASTTPTLDPDQLPTLAEGDTGTEVLVLQRMLNIVTGSELAVDGVYGPATIEAVEALQRMLGLPETGRADHETRIILKYIDAGRSGLVPSWPLPTIGGGGADGCQVAVVGDSLMAGAERLHADRLGEIGCASAVDGVGGRSMAFGWQCRVLQSDGRRPLLLLTEPEPGNDTCAPSGLELLRMWSDAQALGDVLVLALGTNDATLFDDRQWAGRWEQVFAFAGSRPVVVVTTQARTGSRVAPAQAAYSETLRQWCSTTPRCVLADWALTAVANDPASYVDSVHLTSTATDARATFIRDVVSALVSGRPIPDPAPLPTPTSTLPPAPTSSTSTTTTSTTTSPTTSVPPTTSPTTTVPATTPTSPTTAPNTTTSITTSSTSSTTTTVGARPAGD